jgi:hypothetical protein
MLETLDPNDDEEARRTNDEDVEKGRPFLSPSLSLTYTDTCSTSSSFTSSSSLLSSPLRAGIVTLTLGLFSLLLLLSSSLLVISEGQDGGRLRRAHVVPILKGGTTAAAVISTSPSFHFSPSSPSSSV